MSKGAYYNEIDPFAAEWLRRLILFGHIAPGDVDERSIEDVKPDDLKGYRQCHFFAGIGVWSYAFRCAGLADDDEAWSGSCPCQPFSGAGKGGGFTDERHLWPAQFHLIRERRPRRFFGEQVSDRGGPAWLDLVQADLEGEDFAVGALGLCSAGVGGSDRRHRNYFVAYPLGSQRREGRPEGDAHRAPGRHNAESRDGRHPGLCRGALGGLVDAYGHVATVVARSGEGSRDSAGAGTHGQPERSSYLGGLAYTTRDRRIEWGSESGQRGAAAYGGAGGMADADSSIGRSEEPGRNDTGRETPRRIEGDGSTTERGGISSLAHHHGQRQPGRPEHDGQPLGSEQSTSRRDDLGGRGDLNRLENTGGERWKRGQPGSGEASSSRTFSAADRPSAVGGPAPLNGFWRNADWISCRDQRWRPVEPGTFPLANGAPARVGRLRGYGNAVNAQVAAHFVEAALTCIP